ncbi:MAG: toll/interleukin-1 receptor domain-containing protein [Oscillospiraceae bacterium]|nr:toll/interleukin-1 receptor domain-containing protein [Oscillospiraceae bacterium]
MEQNRYVAFISYRHLSPDKDIAVKLHKAIETYGIPGTVRKKTGKKKMGRVFRDQDELPLSSDLGADIEAALDSSEWFIAVCSPRYNQSGWCMRELEYFIERKGRDHVLTILTEGEPDDSFPDILRFRMDEQGNKQEVEPLAADVRGTSLAESLKKLKKEKLRLLAQILGVTYDELVMRDRQRRKKRNASLAAIILVIAAVLAGVIIRNAKLREEAKEQARIAEEQRLQAEEERRRAEEERLNAVSNSIGEALQKAASLRAGSDRRKAAGVLLDALALSDENDGMRREEILDQLRRTMYIEPFTVVSRMALQSGRLNNAQISPDEKKAICIVNSKAVAAYDLERGEMLYAVSKGNGEMTYIAFSPDGSRFVALCDNHSCATVWNTEDGSEVYTYSSETAEVANVLFWKGSDNLLVQDHDKLYLVALPGGEKTLFYTIGDQQEGYDDGNTLYTFLGGNRKLDEIITDYADVYSLSPLIISEDGTKVLVTGLAGKTGTIILNDKGERISLLDRAPGVAVDYYGMSPDGAYAACQFRVFGHVAAWETETGKLRYMKKLDRGVTNGASSPVYSPDSKKMAFLSENTLLILDAAKGKELARTEVEWEDPAPMILNWSKDGKYLTFFTPDLYVVDAETGKVLLFRDSDDSLLFNNVIPVGSEYVFATQGDGEAILISLPEIASVHTIENYEGELAGYDPRTAPDVPWEKEPTSGHEVTETFRALNAMDDYEPLLYYSPEGAYAALLYPDGAIEVFRKGEGEKPILLNTQLYNAPTAFGIVGDRMVAADRYGRIMFQSLTDESMNILTADGVYSVFVFDGDCLMAGQNNGTTVDMYDFEKGERLFSMRSEVPFTRIGFSEDRLYAVCLTEENGAVVGELWKKENALLTEARRFAPGH